MDVTRMVADDADAPRTHPRGGAAAEEIQGDEEDVDSEEESGADDEGGPVKKKARRRRSIKLLLTLNTPQELIRSINSRVNTKY